MTDQEIRPVDMAPHSVDAEEAVLGSILINPDALFDVMGFLKPDDFFIVRNGWVFEAMLRLHGRGDAIDNVTLTYELLAQGRLEEVGGALHITHLLNNSATSLYAETYGRIVSRSAVRRRMLDAASTIARLAHDEHADIETVLTQADAALRGVKQADDANGLLPARLIASEVFDAVMAARGQETLGIPTGFVELDRMLGGLGKGNLIIVAGRPGMGKSALLTSIALPASRRQGKHVAIFSMEMSRDEVMQRLIAADCGVSTQAQRTGKITDDEVTRFTESIGRMADLRLHIDDTADLTPTTLRAKALRLHNEHGLDLVMVDYLQLMSLNGAGSKRPENRTQEVGEISRALKLLARELNCPVVAAAQLNRAVEQRQDKRPALSDLRESGSIENDADVVLMLYRDDYYNPETSTRPNQVDVIVAKHRNGPTGVDTLFFKRETTQLCNMKRETIDLGALAGDAPPRINRRWGNGADDAGRAPRDAGAER